MAAQKAAAPNFTASYFPTLGGFYYPLMVPPFYPPPPSPQFMMPTIPQQQDFLRRKKLQQEYCCITFTSWLMSQAEPQWRATTPCITQQTKKKSS
jgi:hypothetical protein